MSAQRWLQPQRGAVWIGEHRETQLMTSEGKRRHEIDASGIYDLNVDRVMP